MLCCSLGSVVEFGAGPCEVGAIVNAANEDCQGGGGVDGAISNVGGQQLAEMRAALPVLPNTGGVRCRTGDAVRTQLQDKDGRFGSLRVSCVIHAVGPDYHDIEDAERGDVDSIFDERLRNAYCAAMREARTGSVETIGFSLLSAGIFRGRRSLRDVLTVAVEAIWENAFVGLNEAHLVAFTRQEMNELLAAAADVAARAPVAGPRADFESKALSECTADELARAADKFIVARLHFPPKEARQNRVVAAFLASGLDGVTLAAQGEVVLERSRANGEHKLGSLLCDALTTALHDLRAAGTVVLAGEAFEQQRQRSQIAEPKMTEPRCSSDVCLALISEVTTGSSQHKAVESLMQKQADNLPGNLAELEEHGRKRSHWIWWTLPTEMPGANEPCKPGEETFVTRETANMLFESQATEHWKRILEKFATLFEHDGINVLPRVDHGRMLYFIKFWKAQADCPPWFTNVLKRYEAFEWSPE